MRGSGGFVLLLIGAIGLIGFLTGNLDRWLAFLFSPSGGGGLAPTATAPAVATATPPGNRRGSAA